MDAVVASVLYGWRIMVLSLRVSELNGMQDDEFDTDLLDLNGITMLLGYKDWRSVRCG